MNKLTWDNAVLMGPKMADRLGVKTIDVVELELYGKKVTVRSGCRSGIPTIPSPYH